MMFLLSCKEDSMKKLLVCMLLIVLACTTVFCEGQKEGNQHNNDKVLKISWFEGGFGRGYLDYAVELFKETHPDVQVVMDIGPKNHEQLRVQMISGDVPDIFLANESFFDYFALINDEQLAPLNDVFASNAPDVDGTFGDMFLPGILDVGFKDGNNYLCPIFNSFHGLWYSKTLFSQNGWKPPQNLAELTEVSKEISESGKLAAFTYQGIYPQYPLRVFFLPTVGAYGGQEALDAINNLEPGAWTNEAVVKAAKDFKEYFKAYAMEGTLALNHTQAQIEFINHRAAFIPCGTWFDNEMKGNWPNDFDLTYLLPPVPVTDNNRYVVTQVMFTAIPTNAKNKFAAKEFMKLLYSKDVRAFIAKDAGAVMPIKNSTDGLEHYLSPVMVQANNELSRDGVNTYFATWRLWYKPLFKKVLDSMTEMVTGIITPEKFCEEVEKEAERIRKAPDIVKYRVN